MKLADFVLQPRGPYLFDHYIHPETIPTPLGAFSLELMVDDAAEAPADEAMLAALVELRRAFEADLETIVQLVYEQYVMATSNDFWSDACNLKKGLQAHELAPLLENQTLSVSRDPGWGDRPEISARVYMSPSWDEEHGLYFSHQDGEWVQEDC